MSYAFSVFSLSHDNEILEWHSEGFDTLQEAKIAGDSRALKLKGEQLESGLNFVVQLYQLVDSEWHEI